MRTPLVIILLGVCLAAPRLAPCASEQPEDAWWTGPLLASSAATLPARHVLIEPYLFDVMGDAVVDRNGDRRGIRRHHYVGSQTYLLYGVSDDLTAGFIHRAVLRQSGGQAAATGLQEGDLTLHAAYRLNRFSANHYPDVAVVVEQTLPTGRYDSLSSANGGSGAGVYASALALYTQHYSWLPNGRILRTRLDLTYTHSFSTAVRGVSVYGTGADFHGRAWPGDTWDVDLAAEYSLTQHWVLAADWLYHGGASTVVAGIAPAAGAAGVTTRQVSGNSWQAGVAPALEYNFSARVGLIAGVRLLRWGRNATLSVTPAVALNLVF